MATTVPASGTRPPLGVVVTAAGVAYRLDRSYLVGADPGGDPSVTGGQARPLPLPGATSSAVHAELRCSDWKVLVVDRASREGTWVRAADGAEWVRATPFHAVELEPGGRLRVGTGELVLLSPWPGPAAP